MMLLNVPRICFVADLRSTKLSAETKSKDMKNETQYKQDGGNRANALLAGCAPACICICLLSKLSNNGNYIFDYLKVKFCCRGTFSKTYLSRHTLFCRALTANVRVLLDINNEVFILNK
jgi:hypothetical protein